MPDRRVSCFGGAYNSNPLTIAPTYLSYLSYRSTPEVAVHADNGKYCCPALEGVREGSALGARPANTPLPVAPGGAPSAGRFAGFGGEHIFWCGDTGPIWTTRIVSTVHCQPRCATR